MKSKKREKEHHSQQGNQTPFSPKSIHPPGPLFVREDWTLFRTLETLCQKAGVSKEVIPRVVLKELVDNAVDASGTCTIKLLPDGGVSISNPGPSIPGSPEEIASLFSIGRPLCSTKLIRMPTRGALGNGLRVVAGAVLSTGGQLEVSTGGYKYELVPQDDGTTSIGRQTRCRINGTRVQVWLGRGPWGEGGFDCAATEWAEQVITLSAGKSQYKGRTSPEWYDSESFFDLLQAAGTMTVRELSSQFEGCSGAKASQVAEGFHGKPCSDLTREDADFLLDALRLHSRPVKPSRLGVVGHLESLPNAYARVEGHTVSKTTRGRFNAKLPFIIEVWAEPATSSAIMIHVNRTPITTDVEYYHEKTKLHVFGCGLSHAITVSRQPVRLWINIQTPHMPITTDGKAPDLRPMLNSLVELITKTARRAARGMTARAGGIQSAKAVVLDNLEPAILQAGGGQYRYSQRQLYYAVRPLVEQALGVQLTYENFCKVLTEYEANKGELEGMYRDPRGSLYHPHLHQEISLGTIAVERYEHPAWTFNKVLFIEKEGFFAVLKEARWPERHDCALLTSKGYPSRAARDLLDLMGETEEEITFFAVHDADSAGTLIYQTLQEATRARGRRLVEIINLGLEPWEGLAMGLDVEDFVSKGKRPVAKYIHEGGDGDDWEDWLQRHRIELNAMTSPQFIDWLDKKMEIYNVGKVVPPEGVMQGTLLSLLEDRVRHDITQEILAKAGLEQRVTAAMQELEPRVSRDASDLTGRIHTAFKSGEDSILVGRWGDVLAQEASRLLARKKSG